MESANSGIMVLGNEADRIGASIEFDWCVVSSICALRGMCKKSTMVVVILK